MKGIVILNLNEKSEPNIDVQYPEDICDKLNISTSSLISMFEQHKTVKTGPNYLEMQIKRNVSVASFFTGHSSKSFLGKPDHAITIFLSDDDVLPRTFEGQVRRIAFELLPKREEPGFYEEFVKCYDLLKNGELDPYYQQMLELEQDLGAKKNRINDLTQKVSMLVSDRSEHLRNVQALKDETNELYTKMDSWYAQMAELNEYNVTLTMKLRDLTKLSTLNKKELEQKEEQVTKLRKIIRDKEEIEDGAEKLLQQIKQIKLENENLNKKIEKLNETNKKLKFQELKSKRENESHLDSITNLKLEIKKLKDKILGSTNEQENTNRDLVDLKKEIKVIRRERDHYLKIVKDKNLL